MSAALESGLQPGTVCASTGRPEFLLAYNRAHDMRFQIEQRHLTDASGKPVPADDPAILAFHVYDADDATSAVHLFVMNDAAELIGNVLTFPGFQAVATVRNPTGVYTIQVTPTSQSSVTLKL